MSLPEKRFLALLPTCRPRLLSDEGHREGKSNGTYTSGRRGVVVRINRSVSAALGDALGRLGTAGREGTLTSSEQDIRETPRHTYFRILRFVIRVWLSITAIQR